MWVPTGLRNHQAPSGLPAVRSCSNGDIPVPSAGCPNGHLLFPVCSPRRARNGPDTVTGTFLPLRLTVTGTFLSLCLTVAGTFPSPPPGSLWVSRRCGSDRRSPSPIGEELRGRDCARAGSACQVRCAAASKESAASSRFAQAPWIRETRPDLRGGAGQSA